MNRQLSNPPTLRIVLLTICVLSSAVAVAAPPQYELSRLGRLGHEYSEGKSINNAGDVMGDLVDGSFTRTFLFHDGTMIDISPFTGQVFGSALNNKGDIAGQAKNGAFIYRNGQFSYLSTDQFNLFTAQAINDLGQVVGFGHLKPSGQEEIYFFDDGAITFLPRGPFSDLNPGKINNRGEVAGGGEIGFSEHAYLYSGGTTVDLGSIPGGGQSIALAINGSTEITGRARNANALNRAFLYADGIMADLGTLGGDESFGLDVNSKGHVVGVSNLANGDLHAFVFRNGTMLDLGALDGVSSDARTITDNGIVAGIVRKADGSSTVFIHGVDGSVAHDLNDLISATDPRKPFVTLFDVAIQRSVNGLGQVLALGVDRRTGRIHSYVVSPIDSTKPVIKATVSGTRGSNGWYTSDVGVNWTVTDAEAPIANTTGCEGSVVAADTAGQELKCTAKSIGGLATRIVTVKRDAARPDVSVVRPANGAVFNRNQVVTARYTCADVTAGIASCAGPVGNGDAIETSRKVANATFTVRATDRAGNTRRVTRTYSVN